MATHKKAPVPNDRDLYLPVLVGANINDHGDTNFQRDNEGDNISSKNPNYNELTAVYWAWKNLKDVDAVGLVHYRRYFFESIKKNSLYNVIKKSDVEYMLENHDAILPQKRNYIIETNYSHYIHAHHSEPLKETRNVIKDLYPKYIDSYDRVMSSRRAHMFNMFIMKKPLFDEYASWLMTILEELEKRIDITGYSIQEARVFGYISELLMDVWINFNNVSFVEVPWRQVGDYHRFSKGVNFLKRKFLPKLNSKTHF